MLSTLVSLVSYQAPLPAVRSRAGAACMQTKEELATALCPAIGYWDPLGMVCSCPATLCSYCHALG